MAAAASSIKFTVRRRPAVLVTPASPTPREPKWLSDIDSQVNMRFQIPVIFLYQSKASMSAKDPAAVIRDAVARALVPYYPLAGRLREEEHDGGGAGRLAVDCTAEGVLFVEADADVRLEQIVGDNLLPPFPCVEELISDVPGSSAILGTPLLLFQVTRLACGGFVMVLRSNHTMADALGLTEFLSAAAELARGETALTVQPVWERHLLDGRRQRDEPELDDDDDSSSSSIKLPLLPPQDMALHYFFFGRREIAAIRAQLPPELQSLATRFDAMAGWLWKHRTMALAPPDSGEVMRLSFTVNARGRRRSSISSSISIPAGYYGNALTFTAAESTARELCASPVGYAVGLVREAKHKVDMRAAADDAMAGRGRRWRFRAGSFALSDQTRARFVGWGTPLYAGLLQAIALPAVPWVASFIFPVKQKAANYNGGEDDGGAVVVPVSLPRPAMDRLVDEMGKLQQQQPHHGSSPAVIIKRSAL